jgi:hypothetical protein
VFDVFLAVFKSLYCSYTEPHYPAAGCVAHARHQIYPLHLDMRIRPASTSLRSGAVSRQARATTIPAAGLAGQSDLSGPLKRA